MGLVYRSQSHKVKNAKILTYVLCTERRQSIPSAKNSGPVVFMSEGNVLKRSFLQMLLFS